MTAGKQETLNLYAVQCLPDILINPLASAPILHPGKIRNAVLTRQVKTLHDIRQSWQVEDAGMPQNVLLTAVLEQRVVCYS